MRRRDFLTGLAIGAGAFILPGVSSLSFASPTKSDPLWWLDKAEIRVAMPTDFGRCKSIAAYLDSRALGGNEYGIAVPWDGPYGIIPDLTLTFNAPGGYFEGSGAGVVVIKDAIRRTATDTLDPKSPIDEAIARGVAIQEALREAYYSRPTEDDEEEHD